MSTVTEFGRQLLRTGDLDPVYVAIHGAQLAAPLKARLCLAYWCFYHLGAAARIAEASGKRYWQLMMEAAVNADRPDGTKPWPRGSERRHFRGDQAVHAVGELIQRYATPELAVQGMLGLPVKRALEHFRLPSRMTYSSVAGAVQTHRGFGPWIAFKVADMSERVLGYDTDFTDCHLGIYKDPRQGAAVAYVRSHLSNPNGHVVMYEPPWEYPITDEELARTVEHYVGLFRKAKFKAPPDYARPVNVQEVETIFCKYKSHLKGHYPPGKDTRELHHALQGWGDLAEQLRRHLPPVQGALL